MPINPESITVSKVYTFAMAKFVYVQVHGVDKPARIEADKVEEAGTKGGTDHVLSLKADGTEVGKFKGSVVDGWWIQDE